MKRILLILLLVFAFNFTTFNFSLNKNANINNNQMFENSFNVQKLKNNLNKNLFEQQNNVQVKVVYNKIQSFSEPNINSQTVVKLKTYSYGEILTLHQDNTNSVLGEDGFEYFCISTTEPNATNGKAYVFKSQVENVLYSSPKKELDANAEICADCDVYTFDGTNYTALKDKLKLGDKIRLVEGFNKNKTHNKVQYKNQNGDLLFGYVPTQAIKTSGVSVTVISAVIIIITTVSLAILIFGLGKKKKTKLIGKIQTRFGS